MESPIFERWHGPIRASLSHSDRVRVCEDGHWVIVMKKVERLVEQFRQLPGQIHSGLNNAG
jgi:hypothetical protein